MERLAGVAGAVLGLLAVAAGAFGAHLLEGRLPARELEIFETAVRYQMYHALALLLVASLLSRAGPAPALHGSAWAFLGGVLVFSGSLYLLVGLGIRAFGAVTPLGGVALLVGWGLLLAHFLRSG